MAPTLRCVCAARCSEWPGEAAWDAAHELPASTVSPVARGVAIGRAVLVASSRVDVAHYFIDADQVEAEIDRVRAGAQRGGR